MLLISAEFLLSSVFSPILLSNDGDSISAKDQYEADFFSVFMQTLFIQLMIPSFADLHSNAWPRLVFLLSLVCQRVGPIPILILIQYDFQSDKFDLWVATVLIDPICFWSLMWFSFLITRNLTVILLINQFLCFLSGHFLMGPFWLSNTLVWFWRLLRVSVRAPVVPMLWGRFWCLVAWLNAWIEATFFSTPVRSTFLIWWAPSDSRTHWCGSSVCCVSPWGLLRYLCCCSWF